MLPALPLPALGLPAWPGWQRLPREARDTLFQLAVIGWTVAPHLGHLPWWCGALTAVVLFWRAHLAIGSGVLPGRAAVITLLAIAALLTWWTERTLLGKEAGVTMLVVLMALKTLELRARRDALVVFFLGFFLVLTQCLYSQSLLTGLSMTVSTWGLLTAQVLANMPVGRPTLRRAGALAARSALFGLPLMLLLFVLFPRIGPLWGLPQDSLGRTGLSGTLRLGGVAALASDDRIAFRVRFADFAPRPEWLYFRGPVLAHFDGIEWHREPHVTTDSGAAQPLPELRLAGAPLGYEMLLEPIRLPLLPLLEATPNRLDSAPQIAGWTSTLGAELDWRTDRPVGERLHLSAQAWPRFEHGPRRMQPALAALTALSSGSNPRAVEWARRLRAQPELALADANALAQALLRHIRENRFVYTLLPGSYGRDAVDEFWFDRRQGFCEHFAVSFVVLMRAMGVPARLVTGYQGAEPADADGWRVVRQSNAHVWAEYWQAGSGWRRADPTAAVAPERISASRPLMAEPGLVDGALRGVSPELALRLRRTWELLDNRWNQWVLNYSRTRQFDLLQTFGVRSPSWQDLALALLGLLSAAALVGAAWAWWDRRRQDPWLRLHARIRRSLQRLGVAAAPHHAPRALAQLTRARLGADGEALARALEALDRSRYGDGGQRLPTAAWRARFEREAARLRRLRWMAPGTATGPQPG